MLLLRLAIGLVIVCLDGSAHAALSHHVDVQLWPLSAPSPQAFASITYNSTHGSLTGSTTPAIAADESIVRVGYHDPASQQWSGIVTSSANLLATKQQTILLHLDSDGQLYHIGFRASDPAPAQKEKVKQRLTVEVVPISPAPQVQMNKPVVLNADGQVEGPPEKTFLQKYWWAIAGALVLQLVLSGGGGDGKK